MALDLTLCVVPARISLLINKALINPAYAELLQFIPIILVNGDMATQGDQLVRQFNKDVRLLRQHYEFNPVTDHIYDSYRVSASLDFVLDRVGEAMGSEDTNGPLRQGGNNICDHCKAVQGAPVKLYSPEQTASIASLLQQVDEEALRRHYDYKRMLAEGVYKAADETNMNLVVNYLRQVKELFARAATAQLLVLKVVD